MGNILVKNGLLVTRRGIFKLDIKIIDGIISEIGENISRNGVDNVIDASGYYVFPGVIDEHVHMREPGLEYKDDFEHGSRAAIKGGVTTIIDHPNTIPPVDSASIVYSKSKLLESKAYVDFALLGVLHDSNIDRFEEMLNAGVVGFKVFMGPTTGNIPPPSDQGLYEILDKSGKTNTRIMFHAEDNSLVRYFTEKAMKIGTDPELHEAARPPITEAYSIAKIALIAKHTKGKTHIVHVSSKEALDEIKKAREEGVDITSETCPQYLLLDKADYAKYGSLIKVNPPIRGGDHRKALLESIVSGFIDVLGSDHAPHTPEEKYRSIWEASAGFPGVQTLFPLILDLALRGVIPLTSIPRLLAESPAKLFKLWPYKGAIFPGSSGDIVIVDPSRDFIIDEHWLEYRYKLTPYLNWRVRGEIKYVILRGEVIVENHEITGRRRGKWIKPIFH
ncbi:MAG: dihydroorotase family protein [Desulfurococcaceae archaeon]